MTRIGVRNAPIHVLEMSPYEMLTDSDLPSRRDISAATGLAEKSLSQVVRHGMKRAQLFLVTERIAIELRGWSDDGIAEVVAFALRHRHGEALFMGALTVDDLLDLMDESEAA